MAQTCSVSVTSVDQSLVQELLEHGRGGGGGGGGSKGVRNQRQKMERREERVWERENVKWNNRDKNCDPPSHQR